MKITLRISLLITSIVLFFASCDGSGGYGSLDGKWILKKNEYSGVSSTNVPYSYSTSYEILDSRILDITGADYTRYRYDEDAYSYFYSNTTITFSGSSTFTLYDTPYTYSFSGNQLLITRTYDSGATSTDYYDVYTGSIPPSEWVDPANIDTNYTTATAITVNAAAYDSNLVSEDVDWYKFVAAAGTTYVLTTSSSNDVTDTVLALYDTNGTSFLYSNDDYGSVLSSQIVWTCPSSGTYYFKVRGFSDSVSGDYSISVITQ